MTPYRDPNLTTIDALVLALYFNVKPRCQGTRRTIPGVLRSRMADFLPDEALPRLIRIWQNAGGVL